MINNGFKEAHQNLLEAKTELKQEFNQRIDDLEQKMDYRFNGVQNQLDNIYLNYTQRHEHDLLKDRVKRVERKVGILAQ